MADLQALLIRRFRRTLRQPNGFLVGAAVGAGMTARAAEAGGADFLLALTAGRMRMMGAPSMASHLPLADSNELSESFAASEVLSQCKVPVFVGLSAMNPAQRLDDWIARSAQAGFPGVVNWPTSVLYPPRIQQMLEDAGVGFSRELALLGSARAAGLAALAYVGTTGQALRALGAGVELICVNLGWTTGGRTGVRSEVVLEDVALRVRSVSRAVRRAAPRALIFVEGGPLETAAQVGSILRDAHFHGFVGGSSLERLPIEDAVAARTWAFKSTAIQVKIARENSDALESVAGDHGLGGVSEASRLLMAALRRAAAHRSVVLLSGEPGTPLTEAARAIHLESGHDPESLVIVSARHATPVQLDRRLFGAPGDPGPGELANPDVHSVVLQDIERLPARQQSRLARYIGNGWFSQPGSRRRVRGHARLILTATERDPAAPPLTSLDAELAAAIADNEIRVAPLRDRHADVDRLLQRTLGKLLGESRPLTIDDDARRALEVAPWPGNDAQLRAFAAHLVARGADTRITMLDVGAIDNAAPARAGARRVSERDLVLDALWRHRFHRQEAARALGISRKTLYNKMRRYGLFDP
ncbi:MAG: phosphoenolpyruvate hydrolase family protein [Burkholderiaceae bacterium]